MRGCLKKLRAKRITCLRRVALVIAIRVSLLVRCVV
jgi:hypothetical protein